MFAIHVTLLRDVFEGAAPDDQDTAEWPPSWMRLFSALVSVADPAGGDDDLLRFLESSAPPQIHAPPARLFVRRAYVPTNVGTKTTHTTLVARTNGERAWPRAVARSPELWYRWPDLLVDDEQRDKLNHLCRRVSYLGRSTSPALVEVRDDGPDDGWWEPIGDDSEGGEVVFGPRVRAPQVGSLTALRDAYAERFERGGPGHPWDVGNIVLYGRRQSATPTAAGPYGTLVVFRLLGHRLDGRHTARVTYAFRRALMAHASGSVPALHGHHDGDVVQLAFLSLLDVGHRNADGHLLGVAIAVPDLSGDDLTGFARALESVGEKPELRAGKLGVLALERLSAIDLERGSAPTGLRPSSVQGDRPVRVWRSVTPIVLDRHVRRSAGREEYAAEVQRAARNARLPVPEVSISRRSLVPGAPRFTLTDTLRRADDRDAKPFRHVELTFPEPVTGPVVLGSMRHYGLGLCVPIQESALYQEAIDRAVAQRSLALDARAVMRWAQRAGWSPAMLSSALLRADAESEIEAD